MTSINILLARLFRSHHTELVRFAGRLVGDRDCGEEVAQEAYLRMAGRDGGSIAHPKTYLFTAARNTAIDFAAARRREASRRVDIDMLDDVSDASDPLENLARRRRLAQIAVALNELPNAARQVFVLNKLHGVGHREIARRMGVSVSMVEKHMMRALAHCRNVIRETDRDCTQGCDRTEDFPAGAV